MPFAPGTVGELVVAAAADVCLFHDYDSRVGRKQVMILKVMLKCDIHCLKLSIL